MKDYKFILLVFLLVVSGLVCAQTSIPIQVEELTPDENTGYNVDTLKAWVQNILRGRGGMVDSTTIKFTGNYQAFGRFFNGGDIGFDKGLIISNGKVESAEAPNNIGASSDAFNDYHPFNLSGDPDLLTMYNTIFDGLGMSDTNIAYTGDAAALEFVYRPFGDYLILEYIFASEEYPSIGVQPDTDVDLTNFADTIPPFPPNDQIFDLFGISITKSSVFHNLAFTPPTAPGGPPFMPPEPQRWITVRHVNEGSNASYYQPNPEFGTILGTQYDGLTKTVGNLGPLHVFDNNVTPCGSYFVKIVIEDFYWNSPDPELLPSGFEINSALFLKEKGLTSKVAVSATYYSDWSVDYYYTNPEFECDLVKNCNHIVATFTFVDSVNADYSIPFKIVLPSLRDKVEVAYDDGEIITNDSITFLEGETVKIITISAANLDADYPNISFQYPNNPCDFPGPFGGGYVGRINFNLRNNEPISFTSNPKIYEAYCKETLDLTVTDITKNGVTPLSYYWDGDIISHETISYQVQSSPDIVPVLVTDGCGYAGTATKPE